jgi:hypothetical protein
LQFRKQVVHGVGRKLRQTILKRGRLVKFQAKRGSQAVVIPTD